MGRLEGKRAIVTGAASGIGRATARRFAEEGASVVAADVYEDGLFDAVDAITKEGGEAQAMLTDVSKEEDVAALVTHCIDQLGGLDVVHANAGITGDEPLTPIVDASLSDWVKVLGVNLLGPFLCIKHAAPRLIESGGGAIVCTASVAGLRSGAGPAHYSASKAAVINLVQTAACQLGGTGVRVNGVCPGLIETGMTRPLFELARARGKGDKIGQLNPTGRAGQPEEIAAAVLFLASDEASYVNGHALVVDGGLAATLPFVPGKMA